MRSTCACVTLVATGLPYAISVWQASAVTKKSHVRPLSPVHKNAHAPTHAHRRRVKLLGETGETNYDFLTNPHEKGASKVGAFQQRMEDRNEPLGCVEKDAKSQWGRQKGRKIPVVANRNMPLCEFCRSGQVQPVCPMGRLGLRTPRRSSSSSTTH